MSSMQVKVFALLHLPLIIVHAIISAIKLTIYFVHQVINVVLLIFTIRYLFNLWFQIMVRFTCRMMMELHGMVLMTK